MLFSVIVPIYKVEAYLNQCVDSVLNQSFTDYELILVDDGSPDNCGEICDKYAKLDRRIVVIHKENGGLSDARNAGLLVAKGEYIIFLDGDDYLVSSALKNVSEAIYKYKDVDMISCSHINLYSNGEQELSQLQFEPLSEIICKSQLFNELVRTSASSWGAWKNVFRRSIITDNNLNFKNGLIGAEDCDFYMRFILYANRFLFLNKPLIYYRRNRIGSITNKMSKKAIIGQFQVFYENYNYFSENENSINKGMKSYFANKFANTISLLHYVKDVKEIDELITYIREHREVLKDVKGQKYVIAKIIWYIFGFYKGSIIINRLRSIFQNS